MGYLENYTISHGPIGTEAQLNDYPEYFEKRKEEKQTTPERDYKTIQENESAPSRGTAWGERARDSVKRYKKYLKGKVLDIGCGDGYAMELIKGSTGIDISEKKVQIAQDNGLNAVVGRMEDLPFTNDEFDTVFCSHTLEHAEDVEKAVKEIQRVAKRAVIIVPIEKKHDNPAHMSTFTSKEQVKKLFKGKVLHEEELQRLQDEYVLIIERV
jgi:ubiquinone/menaquinone biosynthesis C-methylase UbiE